MRFLAQIDAAGIPIIATMHEVTRDTDSLRSVGRRIYRRVASLCDAIIVHTRDAADCLRDFVGAGCPVEVIPHYRTKPPEAEVPPAALREHFGLTNRRVLLAFGFIDVDKGLEDLIAGMALATADFDLVVAGTVRRRYGAFRIFEARDHRVLRQARAQVRELGLSDRVTFAGYVPGGEVRTWFDVADAAILPYRRSEQSAVAYLANSSRTPVLASAIGGLPEIATATFPPRDPAGLARCVTEFFDGDVEVAAVAEPDEDMDVIIEQTLGVYAAA
jgi:glycogen(starch) synthase